MQEKSFHGMMGGLDQSCVRIKEKDLPSFLYCTYSSFVYKSLCCTCHVALVDCILNIPKIKNKSFFGKFLITIEDKIKLLVETLRLYHDVEMVLYFQRMLKSSSRNLPHYFCISFWTQFFSTLDHFPTQGLVTAVISK